MRPITPAVALVCCLAAGALPRTAMAQSQEAIESLVRRAEESCRRGDIDNARELFDQAFAQAAEGGRVLGAFGLCEHAGGHWLEAETRLSDALAMEDSWVRHHRFAIQAALEESRRHVGRLQLDCDIPGAAVLIEGRPVARLPWTEPMRLTAGVVNVEVRAPGYQPWRHPIEVLAGGTAREVVRLARVQVTPAAPPPERAGAARCAEGLELRDGLCFAPASAVDAGSTGPRALQVLGWSGLGVAAVCATLAIALGVDANGTEADYLARCGGDMAPASCRSDHATTQSSLDGSAAAVNALWTVAAIGAVTSVVGFVLDRRSSRGSRRPGLATPSLHHGAAGVGLRW